MDAKSSIPLTGGLDFMFTLAVFYTLLQWRPQFSVSANIIYIFTCLVIVNDWFSFRATSDIYTWGMFLCDVVILFLVLHLVQPLGVSATPFGYSHEYWLYFGALTTTYMLWDIVVSRHPQASRERRVSLRVWATIMAVNAALSFGAYAVQAAFLSGQLQSWIPSGQNIGPLSVPSAVTVASLSPILAVALYMVCLLYWNKEKLEWFRRQIG